MNFLTIDGYGKARSLEPGQDTTVQQSQFVARIRYSEISGSLENYKIRESSSRTPLDSMHWELRQSML